MRSDWRRLMNIRDRDRVAVRLADAEERFRQAFASAPVGIALVSLDARFLDANQALCDFLRVERDRLLGMSVWAVTHPDDHAVAVDVIEGIIARRTPGASLEVRYQPPGGDPVVGLQQTTLVRAGDGTPRHFVFHVLDVTERKQFESRLEHLADHDLLTGLFNRRRFEAEVARRLQSENAAAMVLDIDHFKNVNNTLGHLAGNELILAVAQLLAANLRDGDVLARLGGDEFAVLLPGSGRREAERVATKLLDAVRKEATVSGLGRAHCVTVSAGVTTFHPGAAASSDAVMVDAELAMYDAKDAGRDRIAFYTHEGSGQSRTKTRMTWVTRIERAIDDGDFAFDAQPILDLRTNAITHHELLLRMLNRNGGRIPPAAFLDVAERYSLITQIDRWVVGEAIRLLHRAQCAGDMRRVEVNLSGRSIGDPKLLAAITADLRDSGVDPSKLIFEITETAAVADVPRARRFAMALRELGCRFALDDFGAGFGSFYYLKHLPFDYLKIDGEFIRGCVTSRTDRLVIQAVVRVARGLGKQTIAEFVGDAETRQVVRKLGVDYAQGAHISMPIPAEQALAITPAKRLAG